MLVMSQKRAKKAENPRVVEVESPPTPNRKGKQISFWLDPQVAAAFEVYKKSQRLPVYLTDFIELAMRELLEKEGHWPPK